MCTYDSTILTFSSGINYYYFIYFFSSSIGFLLCRDDHQRWQRRHCRLDTTNRSMTVHETPEDLKSLESIPLVGATLTFDLQNSGGEIDRDLCFAVDTIGDISISGEGGEGGREREGGREEGGE